MRRLLLLLGLVFLPASLGQAQQFQHGFALTDGTGPTAVTAVWIYFAPQPVNRDPGGYMLRIDTRSGTVSVDVAGHALDRLLDRSAKLQPLPSDFQVRFGAVRAPLEAELQRRLRLRNRCGDAPDLKQELASIIDRSAIAAAFRRHGFVLRLDEIARITQDLPTSRPRDSQAIHIDEMDLSAHKVRQ